jgi:tRNA-dihydrouridine synthase
MIARGSYGNPWLFGQCRALIDGREVPPVTRTMRLELALRHLNLYTQSRGEQRAGREMKKHVAWYIKGLPGSAKLRDEVFRAEGTGRLRGLLDRALGQESEI